jgi:PAS domain-containing protein
MTSANSSSCLPAQPPRAHALMPVFVFAMLVALASVWALTFERVHYERNETIREAVKQNSNLAIALEEQTIRTVRGIDQKLGFVKYEYERNGMTPRLVELVRDRTPDDEIFADIAIMDAQGMRILGRIDAKPVNVADREYFTAQREADRGLFIGKPAVGRATGRVAIHMSRRIDHPDGSFRGVLLAAVDPARFTKLYQAADLGSQGLIGLTGTDGTLRASRVGERLQVGSAVPYPDVVRLASGAPVGSLLTRGQDDGVARFLSYRKVAQYPLVVMVATAEAEVLAPFRDRRRNYFLGAAGISVLGGLLALGVVFYVRRRRQDISARKESEQELDRASARLATALESIADGLIMADAAGRCAYMNGEAERLLHIPRGELMGRSVWEIFPDEGEGSAHDQAARAIETRSKVTFEAH